MTSNFNVVFSFFWTEVSTHLSQQSSHCLCLTPYLVHTWLPPCQFLMIPLPSYNNTYFSWREFWGVTSRNRCSIPLCVRLLQRMTSYLWYFLAGALFIYWWFSFLFHHYILTRINILFLALQGSYLVLAYPCFYIKYSLSVKGPLWNSTLNPNFCISFLIFGPISGTQGMVTVSFLLVFPEKKRPNKYLKKIWFFIAT